MVAAEMSEGIASPMRMRVFAIRVFPASPGNESRTMDYDDLSQHARKAQRRECYRLDRNLR